MRCLVPAVLSVLAAVTTAGAVAYREGRFAEAHRIFAAAVDRAGDDASAELLFNRALAALGAGDLVDAEIAADEAAVRGGHGFRGRRDFLLGNVAFARYEAAALLAMRPEAGRPELDLALVQAQTARLHWQRASMSRPDWPEARRNVERALLALDDIGRKIDAAERRAGRSAGQARPRPLPQTQPEELTESPPDPRGTKEVDDAPLAAAQLVELSPAQVRHLLETLSEKEAERRALRQQEREARRTAVERDW